MGCVPKNRRAGSETLAAKASQRLERQIADPLLELASLALEKFVCRGSVREDWTKKTAFYGGLQTEAVLGVLVRALVVSVAPVSSRKCGPSSRSRCAPTPIGWAGTSSNRMGLRGWSSHSAKRSSGVGQTSMQRNRTGSLGGRSPGESRAPQEIEREIGGPF